MVLSLLFGKKYAQSNVGGVTLDATISEEHHYTARVTSYPIEDGRIISDHIVNEPETIQITGVVTDTPLSILSFFNRSIDAFNRLIQIHQNKEIITVVTGIKVYTNMVMTSLQIPRSVQTGQSLTFVIDLQRVYLDLSVPSSLNPNDPFTRTSTNLPRELIADASKYPYIQFDPPTSLKDQASSAINAGIQDLVPVPNKILPNVLTQVSRLQGIV
jgi:hypothetical protein